MGKWWWIVAHSRIGGFKRRRDKQSMHTNWQSWGRGGGEVWETEFENAKYGDIE